MSWVQAPPLRNWLGPWVPTPRCPSEAFQSARTRGGEEWGALHCLRPVRPLAEGPEATSLQGCTATGQVQGARRGARRTSREWTPLGFGPQPLSRVGAVWEQLAKRESFVAAGHLERGGRGRCRASCNAQGSPPPPPQAPSGSTAPVRGVTPRVSEGKPVLSSSTVRRASGRGVCLAAASYTYLKRVFGRPQEAAIPQAPRAGAQLRRACREHVPTAVRQRRLPRSSFVTPGGLRVTSATAPRRPRPQRVRHPGQLSPSSPGGNLAVPGPCIPWGPQKGVNGRGRFPASGARPQTTPQAAERQAPRGRKGNRPPRLEAES